MKKKVKMKNKNNFFLKFVYVSLIMVSCSSSNSVDENKLIDYISYKGDTVQKTYKIDDSTYLMIDYYDNKKVEKKIFFLENGLQDGISEYYHSNGELKSKIEYNYGKIWNVLVYNDSLGNPLEYGDLKNGNGYLKQYPYDSSTLHKEGKVVNGYKEGYWKTYDGSGYFIIDSSFFVKGKDEIMLEIERDGIPTAQEYN